MSSTVLPPDSEPVELFWQRKNSADAAKALVRWSDDTIRYNAPKAARAYQYSLAYEGYMLSNLAAHGSNAMLLAPYDSRLSDEMTPVIINKVRELAQTFVAKAVANDDPAPQFVTNGGDYEDVLNAENLDEVINAEIQGQHGEFDGCAELDRQGVTLAVSATGGYWVFAFPGDGKVEAELDDGMTIGVVRARKHGPIHTLTRSVFSDPEALIARYPKRKKEILANVEHVVPYIISGGKEATGREKTMTGQALKTERKVRVIQGWRSMIRTKKGKQMGRELFTLKDGTWLEDNDWPWDSPPGAPWYFQRELSGEGGTPGTHVIYRMFVRQQEMLNDADHAEHSTPQVVFVVQKGSPDAQTVKGQIQGATGLQIVETTGDPNRALAVVNMTGIKRMTGELLEMYDSAQHELYGIAKNQAAGTKAKGTTSGIHELYNASYFTERFADEERRLVNFRTKTRAKLFMRAMAQVVDGKYSVWVGKGKLRHELTAEDFDLDEQKYTTQVKPASEEKDSPQSRLKKIEALSKDPASGVTGRDLVEAMKTFDSDRATDQVIALDAIVEELNERWLKGDRSKYGEGFYQSPQKWMQLPGLSSALRITNLSYNRALIDGVPQERLAFHEQYMNECVAIITQLKKEEAAIQAEASAKVRMNAAPQLPAPVPAAQAAATGTGPGPVPVGPATGPAG